MIKLPFHFYSFLIDFLSFIAQIKVKKCELETELNKAFHFIFQTYKMRNYIDLKFFSNELLKDDFDNYSVYFSAYFNKNLLGTVRLILPSPIGFQIEKFFNISDFTFSIHKKETAELSRLIVKKCGFRKQIIAFRLLKECFVYSSKNGIKYWCICTPPKIIEKFKKFGINFQKIIYKPPTHIHIKAREPHRYFFEKYSPQPFLISLEQIKKEFKL